jgi:hypothetical protein
MTVNGPMTRAGRVATLEEAKAQFALPREATRPREDGYLGSGSECKNEQRPFDQVTVEPLELVPEGGFQLVVDKEQSTGYLPSILDAQAGASFAQRI